MAALDSPQRLDAASFEVLKGESRRPLGLDSLPKQSSASDILWPHRTPWVISGWRVEPHPIVGGRKTIRMVSNCPAWCSIHPSGTDEIGGVALQPDGRIVAAAVATIGSTEDFAQACYEGGAAIMAPVDMKPGSTTNTIKLSSMQEPPSAGGRAASESQRR